VAVVEGSVPPSAWTVIGLASWANKRAMIAITRKMFLEVFIRVSFKKWDAVIYGRSSQVL
jgi:hypothetical protein